MVLPDPERPTTALSRPVGKAWLRPSSTLAAEAALAVALGDPAARQRAGGRIGRAARVRRRRRSGRAASPNRRQDHVALCAAGLGPAADPGLGQQVLGDAQPAAAADHDRGLAVLRLVAQPAVADLHRAVGDRRRRRVVGHHDHRAAVLAGELADQLVDRRGAYRVELAARLVGEQQVGAVGQGGADGDALLLAARELRPGSRPRRPGARRGSSRSAARSVRVFDGAPSSARPCDTIWLQRRSGGSARP